MANKAISSKSLFHFTSGIKRLKGILSSQSIRVSYCTEHFWDGYMFALPMACFCDIPLSQVAEHMTTYGCFGIGFNSDWTEVKKLSSVIYTRSESELTRNVERMLKSLYKKEAKALNKEDIYLLSHVKKYYGMFIKRGICNDKKEQEEPEKSMKIFYQEREWRYVPEKLKEKQIKVEKNSLFPIAIEDDVQSVLHFNYDNISYIIVNDEGNRKNMINEIGKLKLDKEEDKYILMSKVLTATQIKNDF